jgi:hypothetical protein
VSRRSVLVVALALSSCGTLTEAPAPAREAVVVPPPPHAEPSPEPTPPPLSPDWVIDGTGDAIGPAGDVNGDGFGDFWTRGTFYGADRSDPLRVYAGSAAGPTDEPLFVLPRREGDRGTVAATRLGDVDGDGFDDLAVALDGGDSPWRVHVLLGGAAGPTSSSEMAGPMFHGSALAGGDLDGDGFDDLVLVSESDSETRPKAQLRWHRGSPTGVAAEPAWLLELGDDDLQLGSSLAVGDVDGDGFDDLAFGAGLATDLDQHDRVQVHRGGPSGPAHEPAWILEVENAYEFGKHVALQDVTADGIADLLVASPVVPGRGGGLYFYPGSKQGLRLERMRNYQSPCGGRRCLVRMTAGEDVSGSFGDVAFLLVPWSQGDRTHGASLRIYDGGLDGLQPHRWAITGPLVECHFGLLGDLDGDGFGEFGVAPRWGEQRVMIWRGYALGPDESTRSPDIR